VQKKEYLLPPSSEQANQIRQLLRISDMLGLNAKCRRAKKAHSWGMKIVTIVGHDLERVDMLERYPNGLNRWGIPESVKF
jgi:hypothetical protein